MGSGRGAGRGRCVESVRRAARMLFFLVNMLGSLFVSCGPLLVSLLDVTIVFFAFTCYTSCFSFRADWATYSFRASLVDLPLLSLARSFAALCAYALCGMPSLCHAPYLGVTIVSGIGTTVILSAKVSLYTNFESRHKMGLPLLLVSSAFFAVAHTIVAYKARCHARRKLCFDRSDMDGVSTVLVYGYQRVSPFPSSTVFKRNDVESNMAWDDDLS